MVFNEGGNYITVRRESLNSCIFVLTHQPTVADNIGAEDGGELTLKTFICHGGTPINKVSNRGTHYVDDSILDIENRFRSAGIG
jgi:hypothetical protein